MRLENPYEARLVSESELIPFIERGYEIEKELDDGRYIMIHVILWDAQFSKLLLNHFEINRISRFFFADHKLSLETETSGHMKD